MNKEEMRDILVVTIIFFGILSLIAGFFFWIDATYEKAHWVSHGISNWWLLVFFIVVTEAFFIVFICGNKKGKRESWWDFVTTYKMSAALTALPFTWGTVPIGYYLGTGILNITRRKDLLDLLRSQFLEPVAYLLVGVFLVTSGIYLLIKLNVIIAKRLSK